MERYLLWLSVLPSAYAQTNLSMQVDVEQLQSGPPVPSWLIAAVLLLAIAALAYYLLRVRRMHHRIALSDHPIQVFHEQQAEEPRALPPEVEKYLKEDERIVLRVLQMKGGSASQGTLRVATNFSKAKLSRVLTELEQRGVVHKDKEGKKNLVSVRG